LVIIWIEQCQCFFVILKKKSVMFSLFLSVLFFMTPNCMKVKDFTCLRFEYQQFAGGTVMSPSGTNYVLEIQANKCLKQLQFEAVWVGNRKFIELEVMTENNNPVENKFRKGERIKILFKQLILPSGHFGESDPGVVQDGEIVEPPQPYSGKALVQYSVKGKKKYFEIEEMIRLKPLMYP
jgi:hypothetical protein